MNEHGSEGPPGNCQDNATARVQYPEEARKFLLAAMCNGAATWHNMSPEEQGKFKAYATLTWPALLMCHYVEKYHNVCARSREPHRLTKQELVDELEALGPRLVQELLRFTLLSG